MASESYSINSKSDKVRNAKAGNLASLDAYGNLLDSGLSSVQIVPVNPIIPVIPPYVPPTPYTPPATPTGATVPLWPQLALNSAGFTVLPTTGANVVYYDSVGGNDANDGKTPATAKQNVLNLTSSWFIQGVPNIVYLKCGSTWNLTGAQRIANPHYAIGTTAPAHFTTSPTTPVCYAAYGTGARPIITGYNLQYGCLNLTGNSNFIVQGIAFTSGRFTLNSDGSVNAGTNWTSGTGSNNDSAINITDIASGGGYDSTNYQFENILIEGCSFLGFAWNIGIRGPRTVNETSSGLGGIGTPGNPSSYHNASNVIIRRNQILYSYAQGGDSSGIYIEQVDGIWIEGNIFHHNGWKDSRSEFNHDIYLQVTNSALANDGKTQLINVQDNIFTESSDCSCEMRSGGNYQFNFCFDNAYCLNWGLTLSQDTNGYPTGVSGVVQGNVFINIEQLQGAGYLGPLQIANIKGGSSNSAPVALINANVFGWNTSHPSTGSIGICQCGYSGANPYGPNPYTGNRDVGINNLLVQYLVNLSWEHSFYVSLNGAPAFNNTIFTETNFNHADYSGLNWQGSNYTLPDQATNLARPDTATLLTNCLALTPATWDEKYLGLAQCTSILSICGLLAQITGNTSPVVISSSSFDPFGSAAAVQTNLDTLGTNLNPLVTAFDNENAANGLVVLNSSGQLPALDGSLLTGISGGGSESLDQVLTVGNTSSQTLGPVGALQVTGTSSLDNNTITTDGSGNLTASTITGNSLHASFAVYSEYFVGVGSSGLYLSNAEITTNGDTSFAGTITGKSLYINDNVDWPETINIIDNTDSPNCNGILNFQSGNPPYYTGDSQYELTWQGNYWQIIGSSSEQTWGTGTFSTPLPSNLESTYYPVSNATKNAIVTGNPIVNVNTGALTIDAGGNLITNTSMVVNGNISFPSGSNSAYITNDVDGGFNIVDQGGYVLNWNAWDNNGLELNSQNIHGVNYVYTSNLYFTNDNSVQTTAYLGIPTFDEVLTSNSITLQVPTVGGLVMSNGGAYTGTLDYANAGISPELVLNGCEGTTIISSGGLSICNGVGTIDTSGNASFSGTVNAAAFVGDGSGLTGIVGSFTPPYDFTSYQDLFTFNTNPVYSIDGSGNVVITGPTSSTIYFDSTGQPSLHSSVSGNHIGFDSGGNATTEGNFSVIGTTSLDNNTITTNGSGTITAIAFVGDGSALTGISAGSSSGTSGQVQLTNGSGGFITGTYPMSVDPSSGLVSISSLYGTIGTIQDDGNGGMLIAGSVYNGAIDFGCNGGVTVSTGTLVTPGGIYVGDSVPITLDGYGSSITTDGSGDITINIGGSSGTLNVGSGSLTVYNVNGGINVSALSVSNLAGFFGTSPISKPTVTGSKGGNAALASLITALANLGLITDSTT